MQEHRLPHAPVAATRARDVTARLASGRLSPERTEDFVLIVCEAVSNAVRHAVPRRDGSIGLRLATSDGTVRGVVVDGGSRFGSGAPSSNGKGHFGLRIIDALSDRWGVDYDGIDHAIWFEVGGFASRDANDG